MNGVLVKWSAGAFRDEKGKYVELPDTFEAYHDGELYHVEVNTRWLGGGHGDTGAYPSTNVEYSDTLGNHIYLSNEYIEVHQDYVDQKAVDTDVLLAKYVKHIIDSVGADMFSDEGKSEHFSDEEWRVLGKTVSKVRQQYTTGSDSDE